jgi:hypothetical protein
MIMEVRQKARLVNRPEKALRAKGLRVFSSRMDGAGFSLDRATGRKPRFTAIGCLLSGGRIFSLPAF